MRNAKVRNAESAELGSGPVCKTGFVIRLRGSIPREAQMVLVAQW
jgi:hypothetical protein